MRLANQLIRAVGAGGQLAPQAEADVNPAPLADSGFDERAFLPALVVVERLVHLDQLGVIGAPAPR